MIKKRAVIRREVLSFRRASLRRLPFVLAGATDLRPISDLYIGEDSYEEVVEVDESVERRR